MYTGDVDQKPFSCWTGGIVTPPGYPTIGHWSKFNGLCHQSQCTTCTLRDGCESLDKCAE